MKTYFSIATTICFLLLLPGMHFTSNAQTPAAPSNLEYYLISSSELIHTDTTPCPILYPLMDDTLAPVYIMGDVKVMLDFQVADVGNMDSLKVQIGITEDGSEVLNTVFPKDPIMVNNLITQLLNLNAPQAAPGISYSRSGNSISLTVGPIESGEFYCRIWVIDGTLASPQASPSTVHFINL